MDKNVNKEYFDNNHVMVDMETLSTNHKPVITEISLVRFCPMTGEIFNSYTSNINIQSCLDIGLTVESSTLGWWFNQPKEAQEIALNFKEDVPSIQTVFAEITEFLNVCGEDVRLWGKGPSFDLAKLSVVYYILGYTKKPWSFRFERCVRTKIADVDSAQKLPRDGVAHSAYDDCIHQIKQVKEALNVKK